MQRLTAAQRGDPGVWRANLGRRATLRYRLRGDTAHPYSEAIGAIQAVEPDDSGSISVTIVTRRGEARLVPVDDVLVAKIL